MVMTAKPKGSLSWRDVEQTFRRLARANVSPSNREDWLHEWSNLEKQIQTEEASLRRTHYANTKDADAASAFERFNRDFVPKLQIARHTLTSKVLPLLKRLGGGNLGQLARRFEASLQVHTPENAAARGEEKVLASKFNALMGNLRADFDGQSTPIGKLAAFSRSPDRGLREAAWKAEQEAKLSIAGELDQLFIDLVRLRHLIARSAGFDDYRAYRWLEKGRYEYTPEECLNFLYRAAKHFGPLHDRLMRQRKRRLGVSALRPWDINADLEGREPLKPYTSVSELKEKTLNILGEIDSPMGHRFAELGALGNLDLEPNSNKSPVQYTDYYPSSGQPVIFMSANGSHSSVFTLIHEFGHANHYRAFAAQPYVWYQWAPLEFQELAAQSLELFALPHFGTFYSAEDLPRVGNGKIKGILHTISSVLAKEAFQHWVYTQDPDSLDIHQLDLQYSSIAGRFDQSLDYSGIEQYQAKGWHSSMIFWQPFYAVDYALAWTGALDLFRKYLEDRQATLSAYTNSLQKGYSVGLRELFALAGTTFPLADPMIAGVSDFVANYFSGAFEDGSPGTASSPM